MKYSILLFYFFQLQSISQEIDFNIKLGKAINNYKPITPNNFTQRDYLKMTSVYDNSFGIESKFLLSTKLNIYYSIGLDFMQSKHYQKVIELKNHTHLGNVFIKRNRFDLKIFGLEKRVNLYNPNLTLSIGFGIINSVHLNKIKKNTANKVVVDNGYFAYSYSLTTYHTAKYYNTWGVPKRILLHTSPNLKLQLRYKLKNDLFFNTGFHYTFSNIFFYDYSFTVYYYTDDNQNDLIYTNYDFGFVDGSKFSILDKNLYFNFGIGINL